MEKFKLEVVVTERSGNICKDLGISEEKFTNTANKMYEHINNVELGKPISLIDLLWIATDEASSENELIAYSGAAGRIYENEYKKNMSSGGIDEIISKIFSNPEDEAEDK